MFDGESLAFRPASTLTLLITGFSELVSSFEGNTQHFSPVRYVAFYASPDPYGIAFAVYLSSAENCPCVIHEGSVFKGHIIGKTSFRTVFGLWGNEKYEVLENEVIFMNLKQTIFTFGVAAALVVLAGGSSDLIGQGRPSGTGGGRPADVPRGGGSGGVDRGIGKAGTGSMGRSDDGFGRASTNSNGRSDDGIARARELRENAMPSDTELNRFNGIAKKLDTTPGELRTSFEAALAANPDLTFGQFVSANVVADNLNERFPNLTTEAILNGLAAGDSLGESLRNLGVPNDEAEEATKAAKRQIKETKRQVNNARRQAKVRY